MADLSSPSKVRRHGTEILTYELPHRVRSTQVYPLPSPNRSTITLHGSEDGVHITWRGGRPLKPLGSENNDKASKASVSIDADVVMIDSEDDEPQVAEAPVEFEDTEFSEGQSTIIAMTRLDLGSPIDSIGVAPLPKTLFGELTLSAPKSCAEFLFFVVATRDGKLRLIRTSIVPSRKPVLTEAAGDFESRLLHKSSASANILVRSQQRVALTLASHHAHVYDDDALHGASWDWIVALYTSAPSTKLTVMRVPVPIFERKKRTSFTSRTHSIPNQLASISFNPSRNPRRHTQLLTADVLGVVRICEVATDGYPHETRPELPKSIIWITSFYAPFSEPDSVLAKHSAAPQRKPILGASWALDGRAIVVLLGDGTWGLWDLEGVGPELTSAPVTRSCPIAGGGVTFFTLYGSLVPRSTVRQQAETKTTSLPQTADPSKLAPMTPNTRKTKQANLFSEPAQPRFALNKSAEVTSMPHGGLALSNGPTGVLPYDSVVFWFQNRVYAIPNLMLYWSKALSVSPSPTRSSVQGADAQKLESLTSGGELITSIVHLPPTSALSEVPQQQRLYHNILLAAEHRHVLYSPPKPAYAASRASLPQRSIEQRDNARTADQKLLSRGVLDLGGLDRMMDEMDDEKLHDKPAKLNIFGEPERTRRVGFKSSR